MNAPITPPRLKVGIVSAGRVGTALGEALTRAGHQVVAVHAVSDASRDRAQRRLPSARIATVPQVVSASDLIVLAVPDTELAAVAETVARSVRPGQMVAHTAGSQGVGVLAPIAETGAMVLALHPAMTFVGTGEDTERLSSSCFGITAADGIGEAVATSLVEEMGGTPVLIAEGDRTLYHAALAHGANNLIALISDAVTALDAAIADDRVTPGLAQEILGPLVRASLDNVLAMGPAALTGPVARDDVAAVARHLEALQGLPDPGIAGAYRTLAGRAAVQSHASQAMLDLCEVTA
ncbi:Rossmann-like and DUF2520 domain-containing protein [Gordonia sp. (in: high G+C Gram-positive bacteria)]|uniref:Rossmann-like and DUF2520 domain-containing protein n=1 Tax=Gordonia sp. (in: high G+C Gram-positive bacteria) TaxID=84139 RepID=UPI0039E2C572